MHVDVHEMNRRFRRRFVVFLFLSVLITLWNISQWAPYTRGYRKLNLTRVDFSELNLTRVDFSELALDNSLEYHVESFIFFDAVFDNAEKYHVENILLF